MAMEIERKFLVLNDSYRMLGEPVLTRQGYLSLDKERIVRVRAAGDKGFLTIKGLTDGITRTEFEYEIPFEEARQLLDELCVKPIIEKNRYKLRLDGLNWDIDEFLGANDGLVIAEVSLSSEGKLLKCWIG